MVSDTNIATKCHEKTSTKIAERQKSFLFLIFISIEKKMTLVSLKLFQEFSFIFSASHAFTGCSIFRGGSAPHLLLFNSRNTRAGGGDRGFFVYLEIFFLTLTNCASRFGSASLFLPLPFLLGGGGRAGLQGDFPSR